MEGLVSIVVPVYNREDVLKETVSSVIGQTYQHWELLLVDDGSADRSLEIARAFSHGDYRIRSFRRNKEAKGAPVCRNTGIQEARGEYLIFLDSDDLLGPDTISTRVEILKENPQLDFIVHPVAFFANTISDARVLWNRLEGDNDLERFALYDPVWQTTGPTWRREFLLEKKLQFNEDARTAQDWEFHLRSLLLHPRYKKFPGRPDAFIRRNAHVPTISGTHRSHMNALNRLETITRILHLPEVQSNKKITSYLTISLLKEGVRCINNNNKLPADVRRQMLKLPAEKNSQIKSLQRYLRLGAGISAISNNAYQLFRKLVYEKYVAEKKYAVSGYRTPMTPSEISEFEIWLKAHSGEVK